MMCNSTVILWLFMQACAPVDAAKVPPAGPIATVQTARISAGTVSVRVDGLGTVAFDPRSLRTVPSGRSGQVAQLKVSVGQPVTRGQVLLTVGPLPDSSPELEQARLSSRFAEDALSRAQRLRAAQLITNDELARATEARDRARAALASMGGDLAPARVVAPSDGVVASLDVAPGEIVRPEQPVARLAQGAGVIVQAGVDLTDAGRLAEGQPAELSPVFGEGEPCSGTVLSVGRQADVATQRVGLLVQPDAAPAWMMAGVKVQVSVRVGQQDGLRVPREALLDRDGSRGVFCVRDGVSRWTPVDVGAADGPWVHVQGDLEAGTPVVTTGRTSLEDGMAVAPESQG